MSSSSLLRGLVLSCLLLLPVGGVWVRGGSNADCGGVLCTPPTQCYRPIELSEPLLCVPPWLDLENLQRSRPYDKYDRDELRAAVIVGVAAALLVGGALVIVGAALYFLRRRRHQRRFAPHAVNYLTPPHFSTSINLLAPSPHSRDGHLNGHRTHKKKIKKKVKKICARHVIYLF